MNGLVIAATITLVVVVGFTVFAVKSMHHQVKQH